MPDRERDERELLKSALGSGSSCPDLAALAGAAQNPQVQRHLAGCIRCRTELAMLREFEAAEPAAEEVASVRWIEDELRRRAPEFARPAIVPSTRQASVVARLRAWIADLLSPRWMGPAALAAASVFVAAVGVYVWTNREPQHMGIDRPPVWRSGQISAVSPVGDITQLPTEFRWDTLPGAVSYSIQLTEVDGTLVWSAESIQPSIAIPQNIRGVMKPGRAFQWEVVARNAAADKIGSSGLQIIHILATSR